MKLSSKQLARTLVDQVEGKDQTEVQQIMSDFVKYLAEEKQIGSWREVEQYIHQVWKEKYGASVIKVLSAHPLSEEAQEKLTSIANGAELSIRVDDRLMGGAVLRIDDTKIDGSITGALKRLKQTLSAKI